MDMQLYNKSEMWKDINLWLMALKPNTVKNYVSSIRKWCKWLGVEPGINDEKLLEVNSDIVALWINNLKYKDSPLPTKNKESAPRSSDATVYRHFSALRKMYSVLHHKDYIRKNPFEAPTLPKMSQNNMRFTHSLSKEEVQKVIDHLIVTDNYSQLAFFLLSICCALRKSEARNIQIKDISVRDGKWVINVKSEKTSTQRLCPLPTMCEEYLGLWLSAQIGAKKPDDYLFLTYEGEQYSPQGIGRNLVRTFRRVGIKDKTCHSLRATGITLALKHGASKDDIKLLSGHKSTAMVETYDKRAREERENPSLLISW